MTETCAIAIGGFHHILDLEIQDYENKLIVGQGCREIAATIAALTGL
jgi:hypothetical protein